MAAPPSSGAVVALFRSFLREGMHCKLYDAATPTPLLLCTTDLLWCTGKKFPNYNVRRYASPLLHYLALVL